MNIRHAAAGVAITLCLAASQLSAQEGQGQRLGEKVDRAIDRISQQVRESFNEARAAVDRLGVMGRVYSRLHWDKALSDAAISVDVADGSIATLRGTVANEAAKAKAEHLAADTVGVERVVNELKITPPRGR
jgi:hyperosmotically inducible periplasmic protein